jgi:hypothetical protein
MTGINSSMIPSHNTQNISGAHHNILTMGIGGSTLRVKQIKHEAHHLPLPGAEV